MENIADYVKRVGQDTWEERPAGELDFAAFSQIVYLPLHMALQDDEPLSLDSVALAMADLKVESLFSIYYRKRLELMRDMAALPRYAGILLSDYVHEVNPEDQKQFCAVTISLPGPLKVICFEGTDLSLAGWKEDFNMSFESPVSAQQAAVGYLHTAAAVDDAPLTVLGHSKGGNLAIWAAAFCDDAVRGRIQSVHSFDGPGLMDSDTQTAGYVALGERIHSYLPQGSLVGILMNQHKPYRVVKSRALSVFQHDLFSWEVEAEAPRFISMEELSRTSRIMDETLDEWLHGMSLEERRLFCDSVYGVLTAGNLETLTDLVSPDMQSAKRMLHAMRDLDPHTRSMMGQVFRALLSGTVGSALSAMKQAVLELLPGIGDKQEEKGPPEASQPPPQ